MKKKLVYVLFACLAMVNMALGQQKESRLTLNPEVPVAGQSLELTYNPKGGPLEGKSDLVGIIYMYNFYHWEMGDVQLKQEGELWKGTFEMPENCAFIAFKFQSTFTLQPDSTDNNNDNLGCVYPKNSAWVIICRVGVLLGAYSGCLRWDRRPEIIFPGTTRRFLTRLR